MVKKRDIESTSLRSTLRKGKDCRKEANLLKDSTRKWGDAKKKGMQKIPSEGAVAEGNENL